jgi:hypothetical protein
MLQAAILLSLYGLLTGCEGAVFTVKTHPPETPTADSNTQQAPAPAAALGAAIGLGWARRLRRRIRKSR